MKTIDIAPEHIPAIAAAIAALTGTPHEATLLELLRVASPFHPLLWDLARIEREMDEMREVAP